MTGPGRQDAPGTGDASTARLLRLAGARTAVAATRETRVRSAVHTAWREDLRRRIMRRRTVAAGSAVAAAAVILAATMPDREAGAPVVPAQARVARVEQVTGAVHLRTRAGGRDQVVVLHEEPVAPGGWIETGSDGRIALRFDDGTAVRVDVDSRLRAVSSSVVELTAGAVYVDTERDDGRFEVRTPLATARDIGTQFEVRVSGGTLRLRVRSGLVELHAPSRSISARAGTEIALSAAGATSRPIPTFGPDWQWATTVAGPLAMEGRSLADFLRHAAREHGLTLRYEDDTVRREASDIVLHGAVTDLTPDEAIAAAIGASGLDHRLEGGVLEVFRPDGTRPEGRRR